MKKSIEVEIMTRPGGEENAKRKIIAFLAQTGVPQKAIVPKSITNIVMHKQAFQQK